MLITIVQWISIGCVCMVIPAYRWPHRFALIAHGWRDDKKLSAFTWALLSIYGFALWGLLNLHAEQGWSKLTIILTIIDFTVFAWGGYIIWKQQKPLFKGPVDRLVYDLKKESKGLPPEARRDLHARIREAAIKELIHLEEEVTREKTEGWEEIKMRLAIERSLWENAPMLYPDEFPPKQ